MEGGDGDCEMAKMLDRLTNGECQGYSGDGKVVEQQSWVGSGVKLAGQATQLQRGVIVEMVCLAGAGLPRLNVGFDSVSEWELVAM